LIFPISTNCPMAMVRRSLAKLNPCLLSVCRPSAPAIRESSALLKESHLLGFRPAL
jgi:hypothetical protein